MRTPFYDREAALGATFCEEAGWIVPATYGSLEREYRAVRQSVGLLDLSWPGRVIVRGRERVRFLQSLLSNDVAALSPGSGLWATLLTNKGRMIGLMRVYNLGEEYLLDVAPRAAVATARALRDFKMSLRVEIADVTDSVVALSLQGPRARPLLSDVLGREVRCEREGEITALPTDVLGAPGQGASAHERLFWVARASHTGEEGYDLFVPRELALALWDRLVHRGREWGLHPVGLHALHVLRLEAGIPWYGWDVDETTIPLEAGLDAALSFTKGCYVGQETIAMIRYRGHINRKLVGVKILGEELPHPGDRILAEDREIGRITSAAVSCALAVPIALGYVKCAWAEPGTRVRIRRGEREIEAEVHPLPFVARAS